MKMPSLVVAIVLFGLVTQGLLAQPSVDSVREELKSYSGPVDESPTLWLFRHYLNQPNFDSAIYYARKVKNAYERAGNHRQAGTYLNGIAIYHAQLGKYDRALALCDSSIDYHRRHGLNDQLCAIFTNKAIMSSEHGNYALARASLDSAYKHLPRSSDPQSLANWYIAQSSLTSKEGKLDASARFVREGLRVIRKEHHRQRSALLTNLALLHFKMGELDSAIAVGLRGIRYDEKHGLLRNKAIKQYNLAKALLNAGRVEEALDLVDEIVPVFEQTGFKTGQINAYQLMGEINLRHGHLHEARNSALKAIDLAKKSQLAAETCRGYIFLGKYYYASNQVDSAIKCHRKALHMADSIASAELKFRSSVFLASSLNAAGFIEAAAGLINALVQNDSTGTTADRVMALVEAARSVKPKDPQQAIEYLKLARKIAGKYFHREKLLVTELLSSFYEEAGQTDSALAYARQSFSLVRHIAQAENADAIGAWMARYNIAQNELKLEDAKLKVAEARVRERGLIISLLVMAFLLVVTGFAFIFWRYRRRQEKLALKQLEINKIKTEITEEERKRIARDLHDSLGSKLLIIKSTRSHQDEIERLVDESLDEMRSISRNLYPPLIEELGLIKALENYLEQVEKSHGIITYLESEIDDLELGTAEQLQLFRVIQEAVNNAVKHSGTRSIRVDILRSEDRIKFRVRDNGRGFDPNHATKSVGLISMKDRIRQLQGVIYLESTEGVGTSISFEVPYGRN
ncbi:MAG: hypothetical protein Kow0075_03120 [Salibacteraceae bacterium]